MLGDAVIPIPTEESFMVHWHSRLLALLASLASLAAFAGTVRGW
jgi:hypothetical protein